MFVLCLVFMANLQLYTWPQKLLESMCLMSPFFFSFRESLMTHAKFSNLGKEPSKNS